MKKIVGLRFKQAGKILECDATGFDDLQYNDKVIVETPKGTYLGYIITSPKEVEDNIKECGKILRKATEEDFEKIEFLKKKEKEAFDYCLERIKARNLPMKLLKVEYTFDSSKATFIFSAENRIDFRELVRDLAYKFRIRIEMLQVGVREEAKLCGSLGLCGQLVCCSTWLTNFAHISIKMAKDQDIPLNASKVLGICGRLRCCLAFEADTYQDLKKWMPKVGKLVTTPYGEGKIRKIDVLQNKVYILLDDDKEVVISAEELENNNKCSKSSEKKKDKEDG